MSGCKFCDCIPCICGRREYPNYTCQSCGYTPCICGRKNYENNKKVEYDSDFNPDYQRSDS